MSSAWLPSNSKPFTKALADANDSYVRLKGSVPTIAHIGRDTVPDGWLPWLLRNAGLQNVMAFVPAAKWSTVYDERAWTTYRGTAQAHVDALAWLDLSATYRDGPVDTDYYDHFDILLAAFPVSHAELQRIVGLGFAAKSTASIYHRVIYGIDVDAARYAFNTFGSALRGFYSGVEWRPGWPKLSLRATVGGVGSAPDDGGIARCGTLAMVSGHGTPDWHLRFGFSRHGFDRPGPWRSLGITMVTYAAGDAQDAPHSRLVHTDELHGTRPLLDAEVWGLTGADDLLGDDLGVAIDFLGGTFAVRGGGNPGRGDLNDFDRLIFARSSNATYFDADGVMQTASSDVLRFDHDPVTGAALGALLEVSQTTLAKQSGDISVSPWAWSSVAGTVEASDDSLIDGETFWLITNAAVSTDRRQAIPVEADTRHTVSIFVKRGNQPEIGFQCHTIGGVGTRVADILYNYDTDAVSGPATSTTLVTIHGRGCDDYGDGVRRLWVDYSLANGGTTAVPLINKGGSITAGSSGKYWGLQFEGGGGPSSYIPTTSAQATRAADDLTIALTSLPSWNDGNGTLELNGDAVTPILTDSSDALDISAMVWTAGETHLRSLVWRPS